MIDFSHLHQWLEERIRNDGTPGFGLAITDRSETIFVGHYGFANLDVKVPLGPEHAIENGSIGKTFTAMLLMMMHERGQVDLHAPVTRYLSWFEAGGATDEITLHHLLSHTAGITEGSDISCDGRFEAWSLREQPLFAEPGTEAAYSNIGYKVLGYVVEEILGISCAHAIANELLAPLGMHDSISPITDDDRPRMPVGYRRPFNDRPWRVSHGLVPDVWIETGTGDGSVATTTPDLAVFTRALLNRGAGLIADQSFARMRGDFSGQAAVEDLPEFGYGLINERIDERDCYGHGGDMLGYFASMVIDPEAGIGACILTNGPGKYEAMVRDALRFACAEVTGNAAFTLPEIKPVSVIDDAAELAGTYTRDGEAWTFVADGQSLSLDRPSGRVAIERPGRGPGFVILAPDLEREALIFECDDAGSVVALHHGERWFARDGQAAAEAPKAPEAWRAIVGIYQNHNPWQSRIRIFERRGALLLEWRSGYESPLIDLGDGSFKVGDSPSPDRISFDAIADGQALRAVLSGQAYYRDLWSSLPAARK